MTGNEVVERMFVTLLYEEQLFHLFSHSFLS